MAHKNNPIKAKTLITSHVNADFDAIGAMLAAQKLYPDAVIVFPGSQEKSLRDFFVNSMSYLLNMADLSKIDFSTIQRLVIVDTRQKSRLTGVSDLLDKEEILIDIYDHHPPMPGEIKGCLDVSKPYGATTTIMSEILQEKGIGLTPEEATVMALGIYEDTGNFTYSSTTRADFIQAAFLLDCGASLNTISSLVVKEMKTEQVTWLNELINEMSSHQINGIQVHVSSISSSSYISDLASIVQKIVRMENLGVYFAVVLMGTKVNIIARNRLAEVDVGKVLAQFGGGGHAYAASAKVENQTLAQVELRLLDMLNHQLKSIWVAKKLMSSPAITIDTQRSCREAGQRMTRYNINTLLAVSSTDNSYEGYITRQVVEKLLFHKLGNQPVFEYMNSGGAFVTQDADLAKIEEQIIEAKQRIIPVMDQDRILGVITRTDLLDYLVEHNKEVSQNEHQIVNRPNAQKKYIKHILDQRLDVRKQTLLKEIGITAEKLGVEVYVVGGFVRDLILDRPNEDVDVVVEGDGIAFAGHFAKEHGCRMSPHQKFGTAVIILADNFKVDVASARLEYYATPAALPIVENSSIKLDMARRDFTINTLAIALNPDSYGVLIDYFGASRDLKDKTIRIIHNLSFVEDPTRVFRAIKFANRFGFNIGKVTSKLIKNALKIDTFKHLSGLRVLSELKQIFTEPNPIPAMETMVSYGVEKVIHKQLNITPRTYELFESVNKALSWHDLLYVDERYPRWAVYFMAMLYRLPFRVCDEILARLMVPDKERHILLERRYKAENRLTMIQANFPITRQEMYWGLINFKTEFILYMMALTGNEAVQKAISNFYTHHRHIKPVLGGKDLLAIGIQPGPVFTKILNLIINEKLDKKLATRKEELAFATRYAIENDLIS
ncbi:MAG: CBS domain-containing protein [Desulfobacter sp.]|nr:CBS domain-containing protein [Desulfobacter sp.]WDP86365.1 MAG: CBS domain-containing protein [Desulfobacter sp.]